MTSAKETGTVDTTSLQLQNLDMAFLMDESLLNLLVQEATLPSGPIAWNYDASFKPTTASAAVYKFSGTLDTTQVPAPVTCGAVGDAVGSGVLFLMPLTGGSATINGTTYSTGSAFWTYRVALDAYQLTVSSTQVSAAASAQLTTMQDLYGQGFQACRYGLDFDDLSFLESQPAPDGWAVEDWDNFCRGMMTYLQGSPFNLQVPLMDGVVPSSSQALWNTGPTDWTCFNVPPLNDNSVGAIVFGFMVADNPMPTTYYADFESCALFTGSNPPNANLILSGRIVTSAFFESALSTDNLMAAAKAALVPSTQSSGQQQFNIDDSIIGSLTKDSSANPWWVNYAGSANTQNAHGAIHFFASGKATTIAGSRLTLNAPSNGFYQQLQALGDFVVTASSSSNQIGPFNWTMPQSLFTWSITAVMEVTASGVVSFSTAQGTSSFPNSLDPGNTQSVKDWWANQLNLDQGWGQLTNAQNWGDSAASHVKDNFCVPGPSGQFNLFAFPGGDLFDFASAGMNGYGTMVLNLTYKSS
jgi:hypothetical protein